jgi:type II secretory pathway pseudopilin PulG
MASTPANSSLPSSNQRPLTPNRQINPWEWVWLVLWMLLLTGSGVFCGWALLWLTRIPPLPDCEQITPFHSARDLLYCAEAQARSGEPNSLVQSVLLTANWPRTHAHYDDSQEILKDSSEQLLVLANRWAQAGKLEDAIKLAGEIPLNTPLRQPAQAVIYEWRQDWTQGRAIEADMRTALATQDWEAARQHLQRFKTLNSDYWLNTRHLVWQRQMQVEQRAWEQLEAARTLAASAALEDLQQAIAQARTIDLRSQVWPTAEQDIDQWSQTLMAGALQQWQEGNQEAAMELVGVIPPSGNFPPEAQNLLALSRAEHLAQNAHPETAGQTPNYATMIQLMEAIGAAEQLAARPGAKSPLGVSSWRQQLADLRRLKFGAVVAGLGQRWTYAWAMDQSALVEQGRPRRIQGQTLIAEWRASIERIEDRPILVQARALARSGTIPALEEAIAKAQEVELGRALRIEAQTLVAEWRQEIQVIEDRPILDAAVALADQGELRQAITEAQKIAPGRALHSRAQGLIEDWTTTIQIAEDKPMLDEAKNLAYKGSLTAAINLASQIAPGRALYREAQSAIALWRAERAYIWSIWEAEGRPTPASDSTSTD